MKAGLGNESIMAEERMANVAKVIELVGRSKVGGKMLLITLSLKHPKL